MKERVERYLRYNIGRLRRAERFNRDKADFLFKIVPLLLHYNHPDLPGFADEACPAGVYRYNPKAIIADEPYRRYLPQAPPLADLPDRSDFRIHSVKTIGSIGTLAQSAKSDCDYWISLDRAELGEGGVKLLAGKCGQIERYAAAFGHEVHFFLMDITETRTNSFQSDVGEESAGSSLKLLLKDELFRSHILVAGKIPLWWLIPPGLSTGDYQRCAEQMISRNPSVQHHFIDLGYLSDLPRQEIFGACLWQLNKALDSPFKSVIKLAYLEYLLNQPAGALPFFSDQLKCLVTFPERLAATGQTELPLDDIDPYLLMAGVISGFYRQREDPGQAAIIRKCLFLKTLEGVRGAAAEQQTLALMEKWGLLPEDHGALLNLQHWPHRDLVRLGTEIHDFLIATYKRLAEQYPATESEARLAITQRDLTVLGRKLFTFYEKKTDKIDYLQALSRESMGVATLTIHAGRQRDGEVYYALQGTPDGCEPTAIRPETLIRKEADLLFLITWLVQNGIIQRQTDIHLSKGCTAVSLAEINDLVRAIAASLPPVDFSHIKPEFLLRPERVMRALVVVNFFKEPVHRSKTLESVIISGNSYGEFFLRHYHTVAQLKNAVATLLTSHYVSRWNNNLEYFIPAQPEERTIRTLLGI
ncbi:MAG: class I adenylate cyclase [Thermodesulfobacteriota bacterium]